MIAGVLSGEHPPRLHSTGWDCHPHLLLLHTLWHAGICICICICSWSCICSCIHTQLVEIVIHIYFFCTLFGMQVFVFVFVFAVGVFVFVVPTNNVEHVQTNNDEDVQTNNITWAMCMFYTLIDKSIHKLSHTFIVNIYSIFNPRSSSESQLEPSRR